MQVLTLYIFYALMRHAFFMIKITTFTVVVALTSRIQSLQTHMRMHHKDKSTKRGLQKLVVRRRKMLDYLERKDFTSYRKVVKSLGLARK